MLRGATMEVAVQSSCGEDWLGGLSLDAVVQKATNLERALSSCKARAVAVGEGEGGWGGEGEEVRGGEEERKGDQKMLSEPKALAWKPVGPHKSTPTTPSSHLPSMYTQSSQPEEEAAVAIAWQHLTTYIVALEKEVQQYKQLLEITPHQLSNLPSTAHQLGNLPSTPHQLGNLPSTPHQPGSLPSTPHQLSNLPSTPHQLGNLPSTPHQLSNLPSTLNQLSNLPSTLNQPGSFPFSPHQSGNSPHIVRMVSHGSGEQTTVEEAVTAHQHTTSSSQDMKHWDALFEGDSESRVLLLVFCYLNTAELCAASRVSRRWYTVSRYPLLWRTITISETVIPPQVLSNMASWCSHTENITLHGLMPAMASCDEDLQSYIGRTRGSLEAALSSLLAVCGSHTLTTLTITECNLMITERVLWLVSVHCPRLQEFCYSSDEFPPSSESLWSLANGCTHIQHLSLPPVVGSPHVDWFTDNCLLTIARGWPSLRSLCVGGKAITTKGLAAMAQSCPCLVELELLHGPDLNSSAMGELCQDGGLQSLTTLTLTFTPTSPKALQCLINHCPCLSAIHLHISLHTYFSDPSSDPATTTSNYERVIRKLRALRHHPRIGQVFHLHEHYTTTSLDTVVADMDTSV